MKLRFWDKVLVFLYVLIMLAFIAGMILRPFNIDIIGDLVDGLRASMGRIELIVIVVGLGVVFALLSVFMLMLVFKRAAKQPMVDFITLDSADNGKIRIALPALEQMVRQAISRIPGVEDMKIGVIGEEDAISLTLDLAITGGAHVPTVTMNLQRSVREYVEVNCGVAVRSVSVNISSVSMPEEQFIPVPVEPLLKHEVAQPKPETHAEPEPETHAEPEPETHVEPEADHEQHDFPEGEEPAEAHDEYDFYGDDESDDEQEE